MGSLLINQDRIADKEGFIKLCPFNALAIKDGNVTINAGCRMCMLCVKKSLNGEIEFKKEDLTLDKSKWNGICIYVDHEAGEIHPVTYELICKAKELAGKIGHKVYCLYIGSDIKKNARELLHYGIDEVIVCDYPALSKFRIEPYTAVFESYINTYKPCAILIGATPVGRQLAPRVAARFKTGLTADCTILDILDNTDLVQIRPAFGGNIMAEILTPASRPQMATVRYKVMTPAARIATETGKITFMPVNEGMLKSDIEVLHTKKKEKAKSLEQADIIVAAGRGVKTRDDMNMIYELANALGAEVAATRPLVEAGWFDSRRQIGLSGRTVRPKLIVTCGVSGTVQFAAGMNASDNIIAINNNPDAPIFKVAHYGIVGDIYEIVPKLTERIKSAGRV